MDWQCPTTGSVDWQASNECCVSRHCKKKSHVLKLSDESRGVSSWVHCCCCSKVCTQLLIRRGPEIQCTVISALACLAAQAFLTHLSTALPSREPCWMPWGGSAV